MVELDTMEIVHQNSVQSGGIMGYNRSQWPASGGNGKWREEKCGEFPRGTREGHCRWMADGGLGCSLNDVLLS